MFTVEIPKGWGFAGGPTDEVAARRRPASESDWREFVARVETDPSRPVCPFCGIRHERGKTHPFCDMATRFNFWMDQRWGSRS